jgi:hypothetical protein
MYRICQTHFEELQSIIKLIGKRLMDIISFTVEVVSENISTVVLDSSQTRLFLEQERLSKDSP